MFISLPSPLLDYRSTFCLFIYEWRQAEKSNVIVGSFNLEEEIKNVNREQKQVCA